MLRCTYIVCLVDSYLCVSGRHLLIPIHTLVGPLLYTVYCTFSLSGDRLKGCLTWNLIIPNIKKKLSTQKTLNRPLYICNKPWSPTCPLWPTGHQLVHCGQLITSFYTVANWSPACPLWPAPQHSCLQALAIDALSIYRVFQEE
jgi:hypothetical protein